MPQTTKSFPLNVISGDRRQQNTENKYQTDDGGPDLPGLPKSRPDPPTKIANVLGLSAEAEDPEKFEQPQQEKGWRVGAIELIRSEGHRHAYNFNKEPKHDERVDADPSVVEKLPHRHAGTNSNDQLNQEEPEK